ncbi:conserved exported protein of unknown function [Methylacidimicrobium sp. AP8]|uniref:hypothetical protein n=1 Tax=Methylacidimicrobium sp. AP8 TaxID=2730359 RepID=UPI0018BFF1C0|nr:hypothetical protein [Methylacidimicrobium sp. AP8]CAB4242986.1 conserved exported protein of unknown function [Methylacidimicrobium sp. AP8]
MEKRLRKSKRAGRRAWFRRLSWGAAAGIAFAAPGSISAWGQAAPSPQVRDLPPLRMHGEPNRQAPLPEIRALVERFFKDLIAGEIQKAFQDLLVTSRLSSRHENLSVLMDKTAQAFTYYGKATGFEPYDTRAVGSRLLVVTYLLDLDLQPLRWRFVYYRPEEAWKLIDIRVDDALEDLISR